MPSRHDPKALLDLLPGQAAQVPDGHFRDEAGRKDITKVMGWIAFIVLILLYVPYVLNHDMISKRDPPPYLVAPLSLIVVLTYLKDTAMGLKAFSLIQTAYQPAPAANIDTSGGPVAATTEGDATASDDTATVPPASP